MGSNRYAATIATPEVFAAHSVADLLTWSDHDLEDLGLLIHHMDYDRATDRYVPIALDEAFARAADALRALEHPDQA